MIERANLNNNEKIIRKVKGLLALANNNSNDEEAQSAFLMAQKLMLKNNISMSEVSTEKTRKIENGQVTVYKQLFWWERELAFIMSKNFRVKWYMNSKHRGGRNVKRAVMFMGFVTDVELAKEMYLLAYEAILYYSKKYIDEHYDQQGIERTKRVTFSLKNSYMSGFLQGLEEKFDEQVAMMREQDNALMVLVPEEVEAKYKETVTGKTIVHRIPTVEEVGAYQKGYKDGNSIDYTRSTIDD